MSFEKSIREDFSDIPVVFFLGGQGTRMEDLAYKHVVLSKQWLPIGFDENNEPIPLFWRNFEILLELGFKEFYIIVNKNGEKVKKYFEKKLQKTNELINVILTNKENIEKKPKLKGVNVFIFENDVEGTGDQTLALKNPIGNRMFLRINGDEYFGGEKEKIKHEFSAFLQYSLKQIKENGAINVFAFVKKKNSLGSIWEKLSTGILGGEAEGRVVETEESIHVLTSLCMTSPEFFETLLLERPHSIGPLDLSSPQFGKRLIESKKVYGKVINVEIFSNVNLPEDYYKLVSYLNKKEKLERIVDKIR